MSRAGKILESLKSRRTVSEANIKFKSANDTFSTEFEKRVIDAIFKDLDLSFEKNNPYSIDNLEDNVNRSVEFVLGLSKLAEKALKAMQNVYFYLREGDQDNAEDSRYEYEDYYNRLKRARSNSTVLTVLPDPKILIESIEKSLNK